MEDGLRCAALTAFVVLHRVNTHTNTLVTTTNKLLVGRRHTGGE